MSPSGEGLRDLPLGRPHKLPLEFQRDRRNVDSRRSWSDAISAVAKRFPTADRIETRTAGISEVNDNAVFPLRDAVTMGRFERQNLQDQHVESALRNGKAL